MNKYITRIQELRDERGWSNNRMSVEAEIGSATVVNWFARNATPKLDGIEALCNAFGISLSKFFVEGEESFTLTDIQKDVLNEFDCLNIDEKKALIFFLKQLNETRKKFNI